MKWVVGAFLAMALAVVCLSVPVSVVSTEARASKMDGKPYGAHERSRRRACFNGACRKPKKL
jgi:hypothetical protein